MQMNRLFMEIQNRHSPTGRYRFDSCRQLPHFSKGQTFWLQQIVRRLPIPIFTGIFIHGRVLLVGCPKLDNQQEYIEGFADIFKTAGIKSAKVTVMEVPCCQGLPIIIKNRMKFSSRDNPIEKVVIGTRGEILKKESLVA
ncbi:MAG: hypothetical protein SWO11_13415 [Thermodesulfobacteriota bacterium]|nr:hypothetical protein [Thermodesulfobacteriota bacterium]